MAVPHPPHPKSPLPAEAGAVSISVPSTHQAARTNNELRCISPSTLRPIFRTIVIRLRLPSSCVNNLYFNKLINDRAVACRCVLRLRRLDGERSAKRERGHEHRAGQHAKPPSVLPDKRQGMGCMPKVQRRKSLSCPRRWACWRHPRLHKASVTISAAGTCPRGHTLEHSQVAPEPTPGITISDARSRKHRKDIPNRRRPCNAGLSPVDGVFLRFDRRGPDHLCGGSGVCQT